MAIREYFTIDIGGTYIKYAIVDEAGVAICCPGKVTSDGTVYYGGALPFMHETPLASLITTKFAIPCSVINDGKAAALAEHTKGNLRGVANGAAVSLEAALVGESS